MTLKTTAAVAALLVCVTGVANAATWTFGTDAEAFQNNSDHGFEGTFDQVYNDNDSALFGQNTQDGITVEAGAYRDADNDGVADQWGQDVTPFLDAESGGRIAGLGVCSTGFDTGVTSRNSDDFGGMSACSTQYPSSGSLTKQAGDDNLLFPEVLTLTFSQDVLLTDLTIRDKDHFLRDGLVWISTDNTFDVATDQYVVEDGKVLGLGDVAKSGMFYFSSAGPESKQVYLETLTAEVPVPAAGLLLLGGLAGLGFAGRRRKG